MVSEYPAGTLGERFAARPPKPTAPVAFSERMKGTNFFEGYTGAGVAYKHPDDLPRKKGIGVYRKMQRDDMVRTACYYVQLAVLSPGWVMQPGDESEAAQEAADFVTDAFNAVKGGSEQMFLNIMDSLPIGFSINEKIWGDPQPEGQWKGKQWFYKVKHKNPELFDFLLEDNGDIKPDGIRQGADYGYDIRFGSEDVVYWAFDPKDDNPYGTSLLRACYKEWFIKAETVRLWGQYLERYGRPSTFGKHNPKMADTDVARIISVMKDFRAGGNASIRNDVEIDWRYPDHAMHVDMYREFISMCNRAIARSLLLPSHVIESAQTGSYNLAEAQNDQFAWPLKFIAGGLQDVVNAQLVDDLWRWNFPPSVPKPIWQLNAFREEDLKVASEIAKNLVDTGITLKATEIREKFGYTKPDPENEDEEIIGGKKPAPMPQPAGNPGAPVQGALFKKEQEEEEKSVTMTAADPVEEVVDFDAVAQEEEIDIEFWSSVYGAEFEQIAREVVGKVGKGNGAPPHKSGDSSSPGGGASSRF